MIISCTEPTVSLKSARPLFDPDATHDLNLRGALQYASTVAALS